MLQKIKDIVITVNLNKIKSEQAVRRLIKWGLRNKVNINLIENDNFKIKGLNNIKTEQVKKLSVKSTIALSLGGDGTMLMTARTLVPFSLPLMGINLGSLGFLSNVREEEMEKRLDRILIGDFKIDECNLIEGTYKNRKFVGFNDLIMLSKESQRIIKIKIEIEKKEILTISGDGVIIATPTGSTAYSMSAGGPIVFSNVNCFIITPICPHILVQRSIVIDSKSVLKLTSVSSDAVFSADSQMNETIKKGESVSVKRHSKKLKLIRFDDIDFIDVMREKFYLGKDPRV